MRVIFLLMAIFYFSSVDGQLSIYSESGNSITGTWDENGTLASTSSNNPYEGSEHYRFDYSYSQFWAGVGLNMDNWGSGKALDFSNFTHLSIAYRGVSSGQNLSLSLRSGTESGNTIDLGTQTTEYIVTVLPLQSFQAGTNLDLNSITEINISVSGSSASGSGTVYFDDIKLINEQIESGTSQKTWSRFARLQKGFNFSNWLEAYWLFPFGTFPEETRFNRSVVSELHDLGFNAMRLPVTFERIAGRTAPYSLNMNDRFFALIDSAIVWAEDFDMPLIITNHHGYELTDANFAVELPRIRAVWDQVRAKYGSLDPERFFFELSNEPTNSISNANFHIVADSLIKDFREEGLTHSLIVGGNGYNSALGLLNTVPYADEDIIYTFHSYDPYFFTHQQMSWTDPPNLPARDFPATATEEQELTDQISSMKQWSETYNLPVFLGEFGASTGADEQSRCNYVSTIANAFISYNMPYFYWDATTSSNAFGFIQNGDAVDCFSQALKLESFNVCNLQVDNLSDAGEGSLRNVITCAQENDIITIDNALAGSTVLLDLPSLFIQKNLTIQQNGTAATFLNSNGSTILLEIAEQKTLTLKNVHITQTEDGSAPAIIVKGSVKMENVSLTKD